MTPTQRRALVVGVPRSRSFSLPYKPWAAYSTRKIVAEYRGKSVQVKRLSDSTTKNIGFIGSDFDAATFSAFAAGTYCVVTRFFDQSGNRRNLTAPSGTGYAIEPFIQVKDGRAYLGWSPANILQTAVPFPCAGNFTMGFGGMWSGGRNMGTLAGNYNGGSDGFWISMNGGEATGPGSSPGNFGFYSFGTATELTSSGLDLLGNMGRAQLVQSGGTLKLFGNGIEGASSASYPATNAGGVLALGNLSTSFLQYGYMGMLSEAYFYDRPLAVAQLQEIDANQAEYFTGIGLETPYQGAAWVQGSADDRVLLGADVLSLEYTDPWTMFEAVQLYSPLRNLVGSILFTNVPATGTDFPGYEVWLLPDARLIIRIIHDFSANQMIEVQCTAFPLLDLEKHMVAVSYSGSGVASGVKFYVDGVAQSMTTQSDGLGGNTIVAAGRQNFQLNAQYSGSLYLPGAFGHFQLDTVERSAGYIASYITPATLPPVDGDTAVYLPMTEGTGTTAADGSGNGLDGTLSSSTMWLP